MRFFILSASTVAFLINFAEARPVQDYDKLLHDYDKLLRDYERQPWRKFDAPGPRNPKEDVLHGEKMAGWHRFETVMPPKQPQQSLKRSDSTNSLSTATTEASTRSSTSSPKWSRYKTPGLPPRYPRADYSDDSDTSSLSTLGWNIVDPLEEEY